MAEGFKADLVEQARVAYHEAPPRWDDEKKVSMSTGVEAVVDTTLNYLADYFDAGDEDGRSWQAMAASHVRHLKDGHHG